MYEGTLILAIVEVFKNKYQTLSWLHEIFLNTGKMGVCVESTCYY